MLRFHWILCQTIFRTTTALANRLHFWTLTFTHCLWNSLSGTDIRWVKNTRKKRYRLRFKCENSFLKRSPTSRATHYALVKDNRRVNRRYTSDMHLVLQHLCASLFLIRFRIIPRFRNYRSWSIHLLLQPATASFRLSNGIQLGIQQQF